jgi:hypothetical protein
VVLEFILLGNMCLQDFMLRVEYLVLLRSAKVHWCWMHL